METEIWKDIEGYEGMYQVSNFGNVKSLGRVVLKNGKYPFLTKEKLLKQIINQKGYYQVFPYKNGKGKTLFVHQLVAMAFLNHQPDGTHNIVVNHIDNNKLNNHVNNLELVSQRFNTSIHKQNPGVTERKNRNLNKKFEVQIIINNKPVYIGMYKTLEEANRVYQLASQNVSKYNGDKKEFRDYVNNVLP